MRLLSESGFLFFCISSVFSVAGRGRERRTALVGAKKSNLKVAGGEVINIRSWGDKGGTES